LSVPNTYKQAIKLPEREHWLAAIRSELRSLVDNETFELRPYDPAVHPTPVGSRWVFAVKSKQNIVVRFKARLVAQGFSQRPGIDFDESYAPTLSYPILRLLLVYGMSAGLFPFQGDITTAYLIPKLPKRHQLFMSLPRGMPGFKPGYKMWLTRGLYGLRNASYLWSEHFS